VNKRFDPEFEKVHRSQVEHLKRIWRGGDKMSSIQTIEIGCPPGEPRPGDLLPDVLEGTGIPVREPVVKCFGDWEWDYSDIDPEVWKKANPTVELRLVALYNKGHIRYASW